MQCEYGSVVGIFEILDNGGWAEAVIGVEGVDKRAQQTSLRGSGIGDDEWGCGGP